MTGQAAHRQLVVLAGVPPERVHQHAERHRAVDAAAGDDDVGAGVERSADRDRTEIGARRDQLVGQPLAGLEFAHAFGAHGLGQRQHVVALDDGDARRETQLGRKLRDRRGTARRVHAAGVAHEPDALHQHLAEVRPQLRDEVAGVAHLGLLGAGRSKQRHRQLGQIVEDDELHIAGAQQLRHGRLAVAPEAGGAADPNRRQCHDLQPCPLVVPWPACSRKSTFDSSGKPR